MKIFTIITALIAALALTGWIMCVAKLVQTDFKAPYKAEIIYGIGTFTGAGAVLGYINIQD